EILLRSQSDRLQLSRRLGQGFSANGDMLATVYGQKVPVNAVADEAIAPAARAIGPTITGVARVGSHVIEELAVPAALGRAFEELATTGYTLHSLQEPARRSGPFDPCAVDPRAISRSSVLAVIGRDDGDGMGSLELAGQDDPDGGDGALGVRWPELRKHPLFESQIAALESLAGGTVLPNPLWQLLPKRMQETFGLENGPLLTVHPLGGCGMGRDPGEGVVDHLGRVLDGGGSPFEDLVVLDGSMIPCALGTNPALTITALALHAAPQLRKAWGYVPSQRRERLLPPRPVYRVPPPVPPARPTEIEIVERMSGPARLRMPDGKVLECVVELTLPFQSCTIASLVRPGQAPAKLLRSLQLSQGGERRAELRVFRKEKWRSWQLLGGRENDMAAIGDIVEARAALQGTLSFLHRPPQESACSQRWAFLAWAANRGARDAWQEWRSGALRRRAKGRGFLSMACEHLRDAWTLASHAAEVRLLEY